MTRGGFELTLACNPINGKPDIFPKLLTHSYYCYVTVNIDGFGLVVGFIEHFNTQLLTTLYK
jgi:hypothetical protein